MLKHVLAFFAFIMVSLASVYADEGYIPFFPDFLEPDGIKIRNGTTEQKLNLRTKGNGGQDLNETIINSDSNLEGQNTRMMMTPITLVLPESLMNSWSFRGAFIDYTPKISIKDASPQGEPSGNNRRQSQQVRDFLSNSFFNDDDKSFISGKDKWALSADTEYLYYVVGYYWGIFIPIGKTNRILKSALGFSIVYSETSIELNLCEEYRISYNDEGNEYGECVGKKNIDSSYNSGFHFTPVMHITIWERYSKSSIWVFGGMNQNLTGFVGENLNFKKHSNSIISSDPATTFVEILSYTYRF